MFLVHDEAKSIDWTTAGYHQTESDGWKRRPQFQDICLFNVICIYEVLIFLRSLLDWMKVVCMHLAEKKNETKLNKKKIKEKFPIALKIFIRIIQKKKIFRRFKIKIINWKSKSKLQLITTLNLIIVYLNSFPYRWFSIFSQKKSVFSLGVFVKIYLFIRFWNAVHICFADHPKICQLNSCRLRIVWCFIDKVLPSFFFLFFFLNIKKLNFKKKK